MEHEPQLLFYDTVLKINKNSVEHIVNICGLQNQGKKSDRSVWKSYLLTENELFPLVVAWLIENLKNCLQT